MPEWWMELRTKGSTLLQTPLFCPSNRVTHVTRPQQHLPAQLLPPCHPWVTPRNVQLCHSSWNKYIGRYMQPYTPKNALLRASRAAAQLLPPLPPQITPRYCPSRSFFLSCGACCWRVDESNSAQGLPVIQPILWNDETFQHMSQNVDISYISSTCSNLTLVGKTFIKIRLNTVYQVFSTSFSTSIRAINFLRIIRSDVLNM